MSGGYKNASSCWKDILADTGKNRGLLSVIERFAHQNTDPTRVVFGTSGWRGEIGTDYTFRNVRIVTAAIIEMFRRGSPSALQALGVSGIEEIRQRGVIVGHDNRFLGKEFSMEVIGLLRKEGIPVWYTGEATTPEFSAAVEMLKAACSFNLTPSHNPANYAGFKFNPSDGGPAGSEITGEIEERANSLMEARAEIAPADPGEIKKKDILELYIRYLQERKTLDLEKIRAFVRDADCAICVDNVHGASRGRIQKIIGSSSRVSYLRTADDFLFGGVAPEPSEKNMAGVEDVLRKSSARFRLGVIIDPDGDRIRFSDGTRQIPMNYFGGMAFHFLHVHKKINGVAAKSVGTSNFVNAIAGKLGIPIKETRVGFKYFRPYLLKTSPEKAVIAFEESDGISGYNHTLEKDALFGFLLAIEMIATTGKNLGEYLESIMDEFGHYYPDRSGISVDRSLAGELLLQKLSSITKTYVRGSAVAVGDAMRTVSDVITVDGTKLVFDDGSWLMIRPSGTEPKVRFYIEARTEEGKKAVFETAERMTREALGITG